MRERSGQEGWVRQREGRDARDEERAAVGQAERRVLRIVPARRPLLVGAGGVEGDERSAAAGARAVDQRRVGNGVDADRRKESDRGSLLAEAFELLQREARRGAVRGDQ